MLIKLTDGRLFDPANGRVDVGGAVWVRDGVIVADPGADARPDEVIDLKGRIVMAGAIDIHSHIAGGKVNIARLLMSREHREHTVRAQGICRCGSGHATP